MSLQSHATHYSRTLAYERNLVVFLELQDIKWDTISLWEVRRTGEAFTVLGPPLTDGSRNIVK